MYHRRPKQHALHTGNPFGPISSSRAVRKRVHVIVFSTPVLAFNDCTTPDQTGSSHAGLKSCSAVQSSCVCVRDVTQVFDGGRSEAERRGVAEAREQARRARKARQDERGEARRSNQARRSSRRGKRAESSRWRFRRGDGERGDARESQAMGDASEAMRARQGDAARRGEARRGQTMRCELCEANGVRRA